MSSPLDLCACGHWRASHLNPFFGIHRCNALVAGRNQCNCTAFDHVVVDLPKRAKGAQK